MYLELFLAIPFFVFLFQMYNYSVSRTGVVRQTTCQVQGVIATSLGIVLLIFRTPVLAVTGFILIMTGLLLISRGLDRINKKIYIDQCADDLPPVAEDPTPES